MRRIWAVRAGLLLIALAQGYTGLWAAIDPQGFHNSYPSASSPWLQSLGPFNQHMTFDFGLASLGLAAALAGAAVLGTRSAALVTAGAFCIWSIPHACYHLLNLDHLAPAEQWKHVASLALSVVLPLLVVVTAAGLPGGERASGR